MRQETRFTIPSDLQPRRAAIMLAILGTRWCSVCEWILPKLTLLDSQSYATRS
jgi:hypothetical protein